MTCPPPAGNHLLWRIKLPTALRAALDQWDLTETQAECLIRALAGRFGLPVAVWTRRDVEEVLPADASGHRHALTDAEWRRLAATEEWQNLGWEVQHPGTCGDRLMLAIRQAGLECRKCGVRLAEPQSLTDTWGLCGSCRGTVSAKELIRADCRCHYYGHHEPRDGRCVWCEVPMLSPVAE